MAVSFFRCAKSFKLILFIQVSISVKLPPLKIHLHCTWFSKIL